MKQKSIFNLLLLAVICLFMAASCTKEGPMGANGLNGVNGENGANGVDGTNGTDGTDGVDGNMSCLVCHTKAGMDALNVLYAGSGHNSANYVAYAGGRASCTPCHSNEQFQNYMASTPDREGTGLNPFPDVAYPTKITCETCHANHQSLEDDITAPMTTVAPVVAKSDGTIMDLGNSSNLCINCHQSRRDASYYDKATEAKTFTRTFTKDDIDVYSHAAWGPAGSAKLNATKDTLTVTFDVPLDNAYVSSTHAGPHHGPQGNALLGNGGYGTSSKGTHASVGCTGCHMGEVEGMTGGHSFKPSFASCNTCHSGVTSFDINGNRTEFDTRLAAIASALEALGALHFDAEDGAYHPMYASLPRATYQAFWNYMLLYEDHSHGAHNPPYFETLLTEAETKLGL